VYAPQFVGGTAVFAGTNTYTGATTIGAGTTLVLGDGGTGGSINLASTIGNSGTLAFNRADCITQGVHFATSLGTLGGISQRGTGRVVITSNVSCSGTVHVAEGSVLEFTGRALPHKFSPMVADGTFAFAWDADTVFSNAVSGAGCIALEAGAEPPCAVSFAGDLSAFSGTVHVRSGAVLAAGESDLPALTFDPGATCRWNVSESDSDVFTVTGDLTLPADGFTLDILRPAGIRPNLRDRVLFSYGGVYDGPEEVPCGTSYLAVHDPATQTLRLKPQFDGTLFLVK
jgi:autotransporter-associated beta strand protein